LREGTDVTFVAWGAMLREALDAAEELAAEGLFAEVIDLATLKPIDFDTVLASVKKTGRCVVITEAPRTCSLASEISANISDQAMVSVETDKAIVEVPAPYDGKVEKLFGEPGTKIHVGAPLIGFEGAVKDTGTIVGDLATKSEVKATPAVRALARSLNVDLTT